MKMLLSSAIALSSFTILAGHAPPPELARGPQDARAELRQLAKEHAEAIAAFQAELARLREAGKLTEATAYEESWNPTPAFVEQFAEKAAEYSGTEDATLFLLWIVQNDDTAGDALSGAAAGALDSLMDDYAETASVRSFVRQGGYLAYDIGKPRTLAILDHVIARGGQKDAYALMARGVARIVLGDATDAERELARADLLAAVELGDDGVAKEARGHLFELENLQVGQVAPDIEDRDLDGVRFKLSDYRGKVVMLDFWGDW